MSSCLSKSEDKDYSIIIPPGDQVSFSSEEFLNYSDDNYTVVVRKVGDSNKSLQTLINVTPEKNQKLETGKYHKKIVPKGSNLNGFLILEVEMEYHETHFYGFIFDSETPVKPNVFSSLTYELLSNYPGRSIKSYSRKEIEDIQGKIKQIALQRMEMFDLTFDVKMDLIYKFLKNSISSNYDFLVELENDYDIHFDYDISGDIASAPFPFGTANSAPVLNEQSTTREGLRTVQETQEGRLKILALDPDGDLVFYLWTFNGDFHDSGVTNFSWTPSYDDSRPETYPVSAIVSDGGKILKTDWEISVLDVNRPPVINTLCTENTVAELVEYRCEFSASDPDTESDFSWSLGTSGFVGSAQLSGHAPGVTFNSDNAELVFTPNNGDGKNGSATFEIKLFDGRGGSITKLYTVVVIDSNQPPIIVGDIIPTNPLHLEPREWDYCLNKDVYGLSSDTAPSNGAFTFDVVLQDPDNLAGATPRDNITLRLSGVGTQLIRETRRFVDIPNNQVIYSYEWKPNHSTKNAVINFILRDDHGGNAPVVIKSLTAKDINQRACMRWSVNGARPYIDQVNRKFYRYPHYGRDWDGDIPVIKRSGITLETLPHSTLYFGRQAIIPKQKFGESEPTFSTKFTKQYQGSRTYSQSLYSGVLKFARAVVGSSSVTVPEGFKVSLNEASTGHLIDFETARAITIENDDEFVFVPITAINRTVPANGLSVIADPLTDTTITVSHVAVAGDFVLATFTRGAGSTNQDVVIPEDTRLTNAPGNTSFEFRVAGEFFMKAGVSSVSVPLYRYKRKFPINSAINHSLGRPEITLSLPTEPRDHIGFMLNPYKSWKQYESYWYAYEGSNTDANEVTILNGPLESSTLTVSNLSSFYEDGEVTFTRPLTDAISGLTVPAGTPLASEDGKKYLTKQDVTLLTGETSKNVAIKRTIEKSLNKHWFRFRFRDYNFGPKLQNDNLSVLLQEQEDLLNYEIVIRDGDNQYVAMDPDDRYEFSNIVQTVAPIGEINFCRNKVNNFSESSSPATCTPCNVVQAGLKYHGSRICYVNFSPDPEDTAESYSLKIQVKDNGYNYPRNSGLAVFNMNITVLEDNEAPKLRDSDGNLLVGGETITDPIVIDQPFIENVPGLFKFYASDGDKTLELKRLGVEVIEAFDVSQSNLSIPVPERIEPVVLSQEFDSSGVGSLLEAGIKWTPNDEDIKKYSGAGGIILKLRIRDNILKPDDSLYIERYYKIEVQNKNNIPIFSNLTDLLEPQVNTYYSRVITVVDEDLATPLGGTFETALSLCKDKLGNALPHDGLNELNELASPALDDPTISNPVDCHAHSSLWGHAFTQFDTDYEDNLNIPECRTVSGGNYVLNQDLAVPKFTRINGPYNIDGKIAYDYKMEWCPQTGQISQFGVELILTDNGDEDRQNQVLDHNFGTVSLQVNLISKVFFESPKMSLQEIPDRSPAEYAVLPNHHMVQTTNRGGIDQFSYPLLISNSRKNPLEVNVLESPRDCSETNGVCIEFDEENDQYYLTWHPRYPDDITSNNPSSWHKIELEVVDTITNETDVVYFDLQVNLASTNLNRPEINTHSPLASELTMNELDLMNFSVNASDLDAFPSPVLHYSWFVNNKLVYDKGSSYDYVPDKFQGGVDIDGDGPLAKGEHEIRVVISDGNFKTTKEWKVKVNNTYLVPVSFFDIVDSRKEVDGATVTDIDWSLEMPHQQTVYGAGGVPFYVDHLVFSGSYKVGVVKKNFLWDLKMFNGKIKKNENGNPWNLYENLPWRDGDKTERLSYYYLGSNLNFLASSTLNRNGPYITTQDAVKLSGDYNNISTPLSGGYKCVGICASQLYQVTGGYGHRLTEKWGSYLFWVDDSGKNLNFDYNGGNLLSVDNFFNYGSDGSDDNIQGVTVNADLKRLYISTLDNLNGNSFIHIYDLTPLGTETSDSGGAIPSLIGSVQLNLPAPYASKVAGPTDIIVKEGSNDVYILLAGVGGVLYFNDNGSGMPALAAANYLGLDKISASPTDLPSSGSKIIYNYKDNLIMGISRVGSQIFTVNPAFSNQISVHSYPESMDSIVNFKETGLSLVLTREKNKIFELK